MRIKYSPVKSDTEDTNIRYVNENTILIDGEEYHFDSNSVIWPTIYNMDNAPSARRLNVEEDKEYEDLWKAERKVARDKKKNNYRIVSVPCCLTCKNAYFGYEGEINCSELHNERWTVNGVDNLGLCDKYAMRA